MKKIFNLDFNNKKIIIEIGEIAKQANGAVLLRCNDTVILSTVCCSKLPKCDCDFFPLTVEYIEKQYAIGKIPGTFNKRENYRNDNDAILSSRLIDRAIRPLFDDGFRNEVQIINTVMSYDKTTIPSLLGLLGSSLALCISDIPFNGPVAGICLGRINKQFIINPNDEQKKQSDIYIVLAGNEFGINMVEAGANQVSEEEIIDALMFGYEIIKTLCDFQKKIIISIGKEKIKIPLYSLDENIKDDIYKKIYDRMAKAILINDKIEKENVINNLKLEIINEYENKVYKNDKEKTSNMFMVNDILECMIANEVRKLIIEKKIRPDGRKIDEIRPLNAQIDILPHAHGSAMFTRGQTQVISTTTLGTLDDYQIIDNINKNEKKYFFHHYNFLPFSVGEIGKISSIGRREIGHGNLVERALSYVMPSIEEFPYTIRVVSDVVESNGSSSQASICASCLSLMAAGVPIKNVVSGIAMGLIVDNSLEKNNYVILTDIQGLEDHFGDMDFKVAGTINGITALQMDVKIKGINREILVNALQEAKKARIKIRNVMEQTISESRKMLSKYALKSKIFVIDTNKIPLVIGHSGKVINDIINQCDNCKINIENNGTIIIYHYDYKYIDKAYNMIQDIIKKIEVGNIYVGTITRIIENCGVVVTLNNNISGLCHISNLSKKYISKINDFFHVGDKLKVSVISIDNTNDKINFSHNEFE